MPVVSGSTLQSIDSSLAASGLMLDARLAKRTNQPTASGRQNPLLPLPAVADNAAMQAEPPKADPPKRKRRWFQFSLRTLMIVVTLLCRCRRLGRLAVEDREGEEGRTQSRRQHAFDWNRQRSGQGNPLGATTSWRCERQLNLNAGRNDDRRTRPSARAFPESRVTSDNRLDSPEPAGAGPSSVGQIEPPASGRGERFGIAAAV